MGILGNQGGPLGLGLLNELRTYAQQNPAQLQALGASLYGAPSIGVGMQRYGQVMPQAMAVDQNRIADTQARSDLAAQRAAINAYLVSRSPGGAPFKGDYSLLPGPLLADASLNNSSPANVQVQEFWDPAKGINVKKQRNPQTGAWEEIGYGTPPPGMSLSVGDNGEIQLNQGPGAGGSMATKGTATSMQESIVALQQQKQQIEHIGELYDPSLLTYQGKARGAWAQFADKAGMAGPTDKEFLAKKTRFDQNVEQIFNAYRKDITGAGASNQELERLKQSVMNTDQSPEQFKAAMGEFAAALKRGIAIKQQLLQSGVSMGSPEFSKKFDELFMGGAGAQQGGSGGAVTDPNTGVTVEPWD